MPASRRAVMRTGGRLVENGGRVPGTPESLAFGADGEAPEPRIRLYREDPDPAGIPVAEAFDAEHAGPKNPSMGEEQRQKFLKALGYAH